MLLSLLYGIHVLICVVLIIVVLLQAGRGSTMGLSIGGGASQTVFGSTGGKNFFARLTTGLAIVFMVTSIVLSILSSRTARNYRGLMQQLPQSSAPSGPAQPEPAQPEPIQPQVPAGR
jgi:preprotein translocase subunit SecG